MSEHDFQYPSKFDRLKEWIVSNGGVIHDAIGIDESDVGNRVLVARQDISKNTLILEVPKHLCLNKDKEIEVKEEFKKFENYIHLVSLLRREFNLGSKSFYEPYLSFLPRVEDFYSHPFYIAYKNPEKLTEWQKICTFSGTISIVMTKFKFIKLYFDKISSIDFPEDDMLYYYLLAITRSWGDVGLVPFADLFQSRQTSMMFLDKDEKDINQILTVDREYKPNDVIWINYGLYDDTLVYSNFGFIDDIEDQENIHRSMRIMLTKEGNQSGNLKRFVSRELEKYKSNGLFFSSLGISKTIIEYLRIINLTQDEYDKIDQDDLLKWIYMKKIISLDNELKVYRNLFSILFSKVFPTKEMIDVSREILEHGDRRSVEYHLSKLTMTQKMIFQKTFSYLIKAWTEIVGVPSEILFSFKNHYLLDD